MERLEAEAGEDPVVAAASVVARAEFQRQIAMLSKKFGERLQKGAGPLVKEQGLRIIEKFGARLKLDSGQIERFAAQLRKPAQHVDGSIREATQLAHDTASAIAEWQHHAILELLKLPEFRPDSRWIARVLDLSVDDVNLALQRLLRLGMLRMNSRERWIDLSDEASINSRGAT